VCVCVCVCMCVWVCEKVCSPTYNSIVLHEVSVQLVL